MDSQKDPYDSTDEEDTVTGDTVMQNSPIHHCNTEQLDCINNSSRVEEAFQESGRKKEPLFALHCGDYEDRRIPVGC
ncbi:uncharacterized protein LOC144879391 isoform X3 [Branchiostoma floridae x Branchiostoma japonicum]